MIEGKQSDGSFKNITNDERITEIGMVKLMNELMGPQRDSQGDYFSRLSQCENFIKYFAENSNKAMEIISGPNNKQMVRFRPMQTYNILKNSWDEAHNNNKDAEEAKLLEILKQVYTSLRLLALSDTTPPDYELKLNLF